MRHFLGVLSTLLSLSVLVVAPTEGQAAGPAASNQTQFNVLTVPDPLLDTLAPSGDHPSNDSGDGPPIKHKLFGIPLPTLPRLSLPNFDKLSRVKLPEIPRINDMVTQQLDRIIQELNNVVPVIETLGFEVKSFVIEWNIPPRVLIRLQSSEDVSDEEFDMIQRSVQSDMILQSVVFSLGGVRRIQRATNLSAFQRASLEIELAVPPRITMMFTDTTNTFHERFLTHRDSLHKNGGVRLNEGGSSLFLEPHKQMLPHLLTPNDSSNLAH
ncbi:exported hypothetical protein [Azospirillaceae bacterium]